LIFAIISFDVGKINVEDNNMCGRYVIFSEEENQELRDIINGIDERLNEKSVKLKTGEVFPTDTVPVITSDSENKKTINLFKWGFPNSKHPGSLIINARSETAHEKYTFNKLLNTSRCIIPASGFYEWKTINGNKEKYLIRTSYENLMYMAGLYVNDNFVILTTGANEQMSVIHNRMPVILDSKEIPIWIDKTRTLYTDISDLLKSYSGELLLEKVG
jgi:putative SOS response-associated peptidase YedK